MRLPTGLHCRLDCVALIIPVSLWSVTLSLLLLRDRPPNPTACSAVLPLFPCFTRKLGQHWPQGSHACKKLRGFEEDLLYTTKFIRITKLDVCEQSWNAREEEDEEEIHEAAAPFRRVLLFTIGRRKHYPWAEYESFQPSLNARS